MYRAGKEHPQSRVPIDNTKIDPTSKSLQAVSCSPCSGYCAASQWSPHCLQCVPGDRKTMESRPGSFPVPAFLYVDSAQLTNTVNGDLNGFHRAHEPLEERRCNLRVELGTPFTVRKQPAEPVRDFWEPSNHSLALFASSPSLDTTFQLSEEGRVRHGKHRQPFTARRQTKGLSAAPALHIDSRLAILRCGPNGELENNGRKSGPSGPDACELVDVLCLQVMGSKVGNRQ